MLRLTAIILISIFLLPTIMPWSMPAVLSSLSSPSEAWAQANRKDLMQQSDHRRRATNQTKPEPVKQQAAGVVPLGADADDGDYLVLAILIGSFVILALVATRGKRIRFHR